MLVISNLVIWRSSAVFLPIQNVTLQGFSSNIRWWTNALSELVNQSHRSDENLLFLNSHVLFGQAFVCTLCSHVSIVCKKGRVKSKRLVVVVVTKKKEKKEREKEKEKKEKDCISSSRLLTHVI